MIRRFIPHKNEDKILDLMENVKNFEIIIRFCKTYMDGQFGNNHSIKRKLNGVEDKLFNPASVTVAENGVLIFFFKVVSVLKDMWLCST